MLTRFVGRFTARTGEVSIDVSVVLFTLLVSMLTGILFGTLPAIGTRVNLVSALKEGSNQAGDGTGRRRIQSALIVAQVAVSVVVETSDVMQAQLEQGDVDLVLGRLTDSHDEARYASVPLLGESQVVVVRAAHPVFEQPTVTLAEMANWSWVLQPPGSPQRGRFEAAMREAGIQARLDIIETASPIAITALLENSDMAAVMPASQAGHYARLGVLRTVPVELPVRVPPICLITRQDRPLSPAAAQFRRQLLGGA